MEAGLTQKSFADKVFVTESAVSKWERGLSYPDITLINDICAVLQISEHELLTVSEDVEARNHEKLAKRYMTIIRRYKMAQYLIYGLALFVCFICNIAVQHTVSWFFIVLASILTAASLTLLPVLVEKRRRLITLAGFTGTLLFLLLVCCLYTGGDWFLVAAVSVVFGLSVVFLPLVSNAIWLPASLDRHKALLCLAADSVLLFLLLLVCDIYTQGGWFLSAALPIALYCLLLPWGILLVLRYANINGFFKAAGCFGIATGFHYFLDGVLTMILENTPMRLGIHFDFRDWSYPMINDNVNAIIFLSLLAVSLIFVVVGIIAQLRNTGK